MRLLGALLFLSIGPLGWCQAFDTKRFDVDIEVHRDRSLTVTERIFVHFNERRHGITREIPYLLQEGAARRIVGMDFIAIKANGATIPASANNDGESHNLRIGDPNRKVIGDVQYTIQYRVTSALTNIAGDKIGPRAELMWNAVPTGWATSILAATIDVRYPEPASDKFGARVLYGPEGSRAGVELFWKSRVEGRTDLLSASFRDRRHFSVSIRKPLQKGHGVTVVFALPEGTVDARDDSRIAAEEGGFPEADQDTSVNPFENIPSNPLGILPAIAAGLGAVVWSLARRAKAPGPLVVRFDPPDGVDPMRAGVLIDNAFQPRDVLAGIVSLAQKGAAKLKLEDRSFGVHLTGHGPPNLPYAEQRLLSELGAYGSDFSAYALRGTFHAAYQNLDRTVRSLLSAEGWRREGAGGLGCFGFFAVFAGIAIGIGLGGGWSCLGGVLGGVLVIIALSLHSPWTPLGARKRWELRGLREFIDRAHRDPIEFAAKYHPDAAMYERLLPYAIAFGMVKQWSQAFAGIDVGQPDWIDSGYAPGQWYWLFSDGFADVERDWSTSVIPPPSSGGWAGGGSGFGGDYSSSGGFDGGGGFDSGGSVGDGGGGGGGGDW